MILRIGTIVASKCWKEPYISFINISLSWKKYRYESRSWITYKFESISWSGSGWGIYNSKSWKSGNP